MGWLKTTKEKNVRQRVPKLDTGCLLILELMTWMDQIQIKRKEFEKKDLMHRCGEYLKEMKGKA